MTFPLNFVQYNDVCTEILKIKLLLKPQQKPFSGMSKKILFPLFLLLLLGCNSPKPETKAARPKSHAKNKTVAPKPVANPWKVLTYPGSQDSQTEKKYVRLETDGSFSNSSTANGYLNADIIIDKMNAGILLHLLKKSSPAEKFTGPVKIKMINAAGSELELTSSRGWNKSGGIMIEKNNNDYSRFRIFMLENEGIITVDITDETSTVYHFQMNSTGFGDSFSQI